MNKRIEEISERLKKATPGVWIFEIFSDIWTVCYSRDPELHPGINSWTFDLLEDPKKDDVQFIAAAPSDIAYLLGKLEKCIEALRITTTYCPANNGPHKDESKCIIYGCRESRLALAELAGE